MKGDFTGFTINGIHSSDLGIVRIADGDRYDETLIPDLEDKTVEIPGNDGSYYYGSYFKPKEFKINIAFDKLDNEQLRKLRRVSGNRDLVQLTFDEAPYKTYWVKSSSPPNFHYVSFDEGGLLYESHTIVDGYIPGSSDHVRGNDEAKMIYKGEGDLSFIAYSPFGFSRFKTLEEYVAEGYTIKEIDEWAATSKIHTATLHSIYDIYDNGTGTIRIYNPGDLPTPFRLYIPFINNVIETTTIQLGNNTDMVIQLERIEKEQASGTLEHSGIVIDTKTQLVTGANIKNGKIEPVNVLYNQYATQGNFFRIPVGTLDTPYDNTFIFSRKINGIRIEYNYLYF